MVSRGGSRGVRRVRGSLSESYEVGGTGIQTLHACFFIDVNTQKM